MYLFFILVWFGLVQFKDKEFFGVREEYFFPSLKFKHFSKHSTLSSQKRGFAYELVTTRKHVWTCSQSLGIISIHGGCFRSLILLFSPFLQVTGLTLSQDLDDLAILYLATVQAIAVRHFSDISKHKLGVINMFWATGSLRCTIVLLQWFLH